MDHYSQMAWNFYDFMRELRKLPYVQRLLQRNSPVVPLYFKLVAEEVLMTAVAPVGYNSKRETGMVGLENLGATCYLNALLQVGTSAVQYTSEIVFILTFHLPTLLFSF